MTKPLLVRVTTVPISLEKLLGKQLTFMTKYFDVTAVSSDPPALKKLETILGVSTYPIEMTRRITPLKDGWSLWKMYRFLKKHKPHIIHSHTPKAGLISMLAAKLAGVPCRLHTVAGLPVMEAKGMKRSLLLYIEKLTYAAATKVYPNSQGLLEFISENKLTNPMKMKMIANGSSNGIDTDFFDAKHFSSETLQNLRNQLGIEKNSFVFVFVGRLVGDKGINELVEAFDCISQNTQNVKLLLVGTLESKLDPLKDSTLERIKNNHHIISAGWQSDVRPYLALSNALVFPSYREGFPNVVMQAGAMGIPVIVSDINGCNEIVVNFRNGIIIPVKDATTLEESMLILLEDSSLYTQLMANARPMIESRYQQSVVWDALLEEYRTLLPELTLDDVY